MVAETMKKTLVLCLFLCGLSYASAQTREELGKMLEAIDDKRYEFTFEEFTKGIADDVGIPHGNDEPLKRPCDIKLFFKRFAGIGEFAYLEPIMIDEKSTLENIKGESHEFSIAFPQTTHKTYYNIKINLFMNPLKHKVKAVKKDNGFEIVSPQDNVMYFWRDGITIKVVFGGSPDTPPAEKERVMRGFVNEAINLIDGKAEFEPKDKPEYITIRKRDEQRRAEREKKRAELKKRLEAESIEKKRKERLADYEKLRSEFLAGINDFLPYRWRWTKPKNTYKHFIQTHFGDGELYSDAALAKNECIGKVPVMGIRKRFPVQESKNKVTEKDILSEFSNLKALVYKPFTTEHGFEFPRGFVNYCGIRDKNDIKKVHDYIIGVIYCDSKAQARDALAYMIMNHPVIEDASKLIPDTIRRDDLALGDIAFSCKGEILDDLTTKKDTNNSQIYFIRNNTAVIVKSMRKDDSVLDTAKWIDEMLTK